MKLFALFLSLISASAMAAPSIVGTKLQRGLAINTMDDPGMVPFYSAQLWESMAGDSSRKVMKTSMLSMTCDTLISEPQKQRFGSCSIDIPMNRVKDINGDYGVMLTRGEAKEILKYFVGGESPESPRSVHTNIADGTILISADHVRGVFMFVVKKSIFDE